MTDVKCDIKRLYFGFDIQAPWPKSLPKGRIIQEKERHLTLAFLGNKSVSEQLAALSELPLPPYLFGPTGIFHKCLFLPSRHPHCVSWEVSWHRSISEYQEALTRYLVAKNLMKEPTREFHSHVTVCRRPFVLHDWQKSFTRLPLFAKGLHLFESLGHSTYKSHWQYPFIEPFTEIEHTADIAYILRGSSMHELFIHAQIALAFSFPKLTPYLMTNEAPETIEDMVSSLNKIIAIADQEIGSPLKAVSFHGDIVKKSETHLEWEMICDV